MRVYRTSIFFFVAQLLLEGPKSITCARVSVTRLLETLNAEQGEDLSPFDHGALNGSSSTRVIGAELPPGMKQATSLGLPHLFTSVHDPVVEPGYLTIATMNRSVILDAKLDPNITRLQSQQPPQPPQLQQTSYVAKVGGHEEQQSSALVSLQAAVHRAGVRAASLFSARSPVFSQPFYSLLLGFLYTFVPIVLGLCCLACCLVKPDQRAGAQDSPSDESPVYRRRMMKSVHKSMKSTVNAGKVSRGDEQSEPYRFGDFTRGMIAKAKGTNSPKPANSDTDEAGNASSRLALSHPGLSAAPSDLDSTGDERSRDRHSSK